MKTAEQMFNELGYERNKETSPKLIVYERDSIFIDTIIFNLERKSISFYNRTVDHYCLDTLSLSIKELKAIYKLCLELGWIENRETPMKVFKESRQDALCLNCNAYIPFDMLNDPIESTPNYCKKCGQRLDWSNDAEDE